MVGVLGRERLVGRVQKLGGVLRKRLVGYGAKGWWGMAQKVGGV